MKNLRAIIFILTAAFALSACESPTDIAGKQNVSPVGVVPVKSINIEVEKALPQNVEELRAAIVKAEFSAQDSYVDINSDPARLWLNFSVKTPVPNQQEGIFLKEFTISLQDIIADGSKYSITSGVNQSNAGADFHILSRFTTPQGLQQVMENTITGAQSTVTINFDHLAGEKSIIGNLTAYMAKDTVMRIPLNITAEEAEAIYRNYEAMGFEVKDGRPNIDSVTNELIIPATQVFLNIKSKITIEY